MFIHASPRSGQPSGVWWPKIGWPSRATSCAVRGVVSGCASTARSADATTSNGVFTLARYAARLKNSGDVTMQRTVSRMSPSVFVNVLRAAIDERLRRLVAHEVARELRRDEARRRRSTRDDVEHFLAFLDAAAGRELLPEDRLLARVVDRRIEDELAGLPVERPSGERARDFLHVLLRVAAVDAERVQLHQLARIVLVEAALRLLLQALHQLLRALRALRSAIARAPRAATAARAADAAETGRRAIESAAATASAVARDERGLRAVGRALPVVEEEQHRRTLRHRAEQIAELAERVRADHVAVVAARGRGASDPCRRRR